jgi:plastocyanin
MSVALTIAAVALGPAEALGGARAASTHRTSVKCKKGTKRQRGSKHCTKIKKPVTKPPATPPDSVVIQGYAFHPGVLTIKPGATVTWLFRDNGIAHWVVSDTETLVFQSSPQTSGSLTVNFPQAGAYDYSCSLHPWMKGEIIVASPS